MGERKRKLKSGTSIARTQLPEIATPWSREKRLGLQDAMKEECDRVCKKIGAEGAVMIAFFDGGNVIHRLVAGNGTPMPLDELFRQLANNYAAAGFDLVEPKKETVQ